MKPFRIAIVCMISIALTACSGNRFAQWRPHPPPSTPDPLDRTATDAGRVWSTQAAADACLERGLMYAGQVDLDSLLCSFRLLQAGEWPEQVQARIMRLHNRHLNGVARYLLRGGELPGTAEINASTRIHIQSSAAIAPFRRFILVEDIKALDNDLQALPQSGIGAALVGVRANRGRGLDRFYPLEGVFRPFNLHLIDADMENGRLLLRMRLRLMSQATRTAIGQRRLPLSYAPASAYLLLLEHANIDQLQWTGLVDAAAAEQRAGIFGIEPLSDVKTPILMIHGLNSSPLIWRQLTMAILNDPRLHERYQVWHAFYASGPPPFFNASKLRRQLRQLRNRLNPELPTVLIGHSMGGVIARTFVVDTGYRLWDATFVRRPEDLLQDEQIDPALLEVLIFSAEFDTRKVFFIDTPHRGSEVARSLIGRIGSALINLPDSFLDMFRSLIDRAGAGAVTPQMRPFLADYGPNSIQVLRPGHPLSRELNDLPLRAEAYSIIGSTSLLDCGDPRDCRSVSDGVVPYPSAHIEQAKDELVVPSAHDSYRHPDAVEFILDELRSGYH